MPIIKRDDISGLSIATRPDCLSKDTISFLDELNMIKPVWVELGLQTSKEESIKYIRRGYETKIYDDAVKCLNEKGIHTITHIILGLPGEDENDMLGSVRHALEAGTKGLKLQLLHVLKGTDLENDYKEGKFETLTFEGYLEILKKCLEIIPDEIVIHRLTGDGPKKMLVSPLWSADKKRVMNAIRSIT